MIDTIKIDELNPLLTKTDLATNDKLVVSDTDESIFEKTKRVDLSVLADYVKDLVNQSLEIGLGFTVTNVTQGVYEDGDTISTTDTIPSIIRNMLLNGGVVVFTSPTITLSVVVGTNDSPYAPGDSLSVTLQVDYTKNDAGDLNSLILLKDGSTHATYGGDLTAATISWQIPISDTLSNTDTYKAVANYQQGPDKLDALGDTVATTIVAGTINSNEEIFEVGLQTYYGWYQTSPLQVSDINATFIQNFDTSPAFNNGTYHSTYSVGIEAGDILVTPTPPAGYKAFVIAVEQARDVESVILQNTALNQLDTDNFTTVTIGGKVFNVYWLNFLTAGGSVTSDPPFEITIS